MAIVGNTVTLKGIFPSDIGDLSLLSNVVVTLYTENLGVSLGTFTPTKISDGIYEAKIQIPDDYMPNNILYEFSGTLNGNKYVGRQPIRRSYF